MAVHSREFRLLRQLGVLVLAVGLGHLTGCREQPTSTTAARPGTHLRLQAGAAIEESVKVGRESHPAFRARPGTTYAWEFMVPDDGGRLELAGGGTCVDGPACSGAAEFDIRGTAAGQRDLLFARTIRLEVPTPTWRRELIDLDPWSGRRVELELVASASVGADGSSAESLESSSPVSDSDPDLWWAAPLILSSREEARPNVVLISIDTLRADHLGSYGHQRDTSPTLDALAADGVRFDRAFSQAPWTTPSHMSLMTSRYPSAHGVNPSFSRFLEAHRGEAPYPSMSNELRPLAAYLRDQGYLTLGVTGGVTVGAELGFSRGFDRYFDDEANPPSPELESRLRSWLRAYGPSPFFLFFHTFEVHAPYSRVHFADEVLSADQLDALNAFWRSTHENPLMEFHTYLRERGLDRAEITSALYDGGVLEADRTVAMLIEQLRDLGVYDRTLIIVMSDHGEEFGDHDPARVYDAHCSTLYEELIRVPLIFKLPGSEWAGRTIHDLVEIVDVAPTILELVGIDVPEEMQGSSLVPLLAGPVTSDRASPAEQPGVSEGHPPDLVETAFSESTCGEPEWKSIRTPRHKYIATFELSGTNRSGVPGRMSGEHLYDLGADPGELHDLAPLAPSSLTLLRERLVENLMESARLGSELETGEAELSEEMLRRLRALGYIR